MSIDEQQMRAIAFLAARCRPTGAKPWDEPGIVANLRKIAHVDAAEVIVATIRAAANRKAESPGVIPNMTGEHWREKVAERQPARPPRREEECRRHPGQHADRCGGCRADQLAATYEDDPEPTGPPMDREAALQAARAALVAAKHTDDEETPA